MVHLTVIFPLFSPELALGYRFETSRVRGSAFTRVLNRYQPIKLDAMAHMLKVSLIASQACFSSHDKVMEQWTKLLIVLLHRIVVIGLQADFTLVQTFSRL